MVDKLIKHFSENLHNQVTEADKQRLTQLSEQQPFAVHLYQNEDDAPNALHLKLYGLGEAQSLSNVLPMLENFGVSVLVVYPYELCDEQGQRSWLQCYDLRLRQAENVDMAVVQVQVEEGLRRILQGEIESDQYNDLVLTTALDVDDVVVLRALGKYMQQAGAPFSATYIQQALIANRSLAEALLALFAARFNPQQGEREQAITQALAQVQALLKAVKNLDEDRILHWYLDLIQAMVRTNFYQRDDNGKRKDYLSFKFAAERIADLPKPKPMFEIYVYSPRMEAVHLRGGEVARGGLRWSDRLEDFRTEVLGLVKAQMVKNAIIVPMGSKGGFIVKTPTDSREALMAEGRECYRTFMRGMLDITDNFIDGAVVPPKDVVRHDVDDPYLVVAADKGTASFSDLANSVSAEYNFWLGDAFASGGSAGYDHKAMGITARGAWESVKRHFRLLGKDIQQRDEINVIGIGDMSGDVFGNGMLLSRKIRLQAAFNHLHIFIDPNPDCAASHQERQRLFDLPRSTWADYQAELISAGGGVFSRQDRTIPISAEMKSAFAIEADELSPTELINRLLKAPVDLLWNGGIGTYIKHSDESHADVGDKANDGLRVNGAEVRATVIGEGGNLGMTQLGRIEYALNGGRLYTDAIDNSAGVNSSDHEVNIKILFNQVMQQGRLSEEARNELLEAMTDEVADLVLRQNYLQPQTIEVSASRPQALADHARIIRRLEQEGRIDRAIEYLPDEETISARLNQGRGLSNPELAVVLAYGKMWLYDHLLASSLPDNPYFARELFAYFPSQMRESFKADILAHRLRREIISTYLTNSVFDRMSMSFVFRAQEETGADPATVTTCYAIASAVFDVAQYWTALEQMDNIVDANLQIELEIRVRLLLERTTFWFLRNIENPVDIEAVIARFAPVVKALTVDSAFFQTRFAEQLAADKSALLSAGLNDEQAQLFSTLSLFDATLDIALLAEQTGVDVSATANLYFSLRKRVHGTWLLEQARQLPADDSWDRRARNAQINAFSAFLRSTALTLIQAEAKATALEQWQKTQTEGLARVDNMVSELEKQAPSLARLSVLLGEINALGNTVVE